MFYEKNSLSCLFLSLLMIAACAKNTGSRRDTRGIEDDKGGPVAAGENVTWLEIKPIFEKFCVNCHKERGKVNIGSYEVVARLAKEGKLKERVVDSKTMPQIGSVEAAGFQPVFRELVAKFIAGGALEKPGAKPVNGGNGNGPGGPAGPFAVVNQCTSCHGTTGYSNDDSIPNLARQNSDYLMREMQQFADGKRKIFGHNDKAMETICNMFPAQKEGECGLTEDIKIIISAYFQLMPNPYRFDTAGFDRALFKKGMEVNKSFACADCHAIYNASNNTYENAGPDFGFSYIPRLAGQPKGYLFNQMKNWQNGNRTASDPDNPIMDFMFDGMPEDDMKALSYYFNLLGSIDRDTAEEIEAELN